MKTQNVQWGIAGMMVALAAAVLGLLPQATYAADNSALLGGGNALIRATSGQSLGLSRSSSVSDLFSHLSFASTRGGRPEETPPANGNADQNSNTGGNTSSEQSDGENGADATSAGGAGGNGGNPSTDSTGSLQASSGQVNGGVTAGNGGNGGSGGGADPGGLVRAGNVVSNADAINAINTTIIRIGNR